MTIESYAELKTAVADYAHRSDLTAKIPDFIKLAEADANRRMGTSFNITERPDGATNTLLEIAPDVYLYGALAQAAMYTRSNEELAKWTSLYLATLETAHDKLQEMAGLYDETAEMDFPLNADSGTYDIETDT